MTSLFQKAASVSISALAILGLSATTAAAQTTPRESYEPVLELDQADAQGFEATFQNGTVQENSDGSLTLTDESGDTVAALDAQFQLNSGEVVDISYTTNDNNIIADFETEISKDEADEFIIDPEADQNETGSQLRANSVECGLAVAGAAGSYVGAAGAALTAPFTAGGGLVVAGAAITSGTAGVNAAYQCYG